MKARAGGVAFGRGAGGFLPAKSTGFINAGTPSTQKARSLLQLVFSKTSDPAEIQRIFS